MKLTPQHLFASTQKGLLPAYLLFGEEELLIQESLDTLRKAAKLAGFDERLVFNIDSKTDWQPIIDASQSLGLFSSRQLIELHLPTGNPGKAGSEALESLISRVDEDLLWLVVCGALDKRQQKAAWVSPFERLGGVVQHWPVKSQQLPQWLQTRLQSRGVTADPQALNKLAWFVEGNLMAANQEVERLALLYPKGHLTLAQVDASVSENARFGVFSLTDTWLSGSAKRSLRVLAQQRDEGVMPPVIVALLAKEFSLLARMAFAQSRGESIQAVLKSLRVWESKAQLLSRAVARYSLAKWQAGLVALSAIDAASKGQGPGDAWLMLEDLLVNYEVGS